MNLDRDSELIEEMRRLKIYEKDISEKFIRSSGPGGQNVNKVSTCVMLEHMPTGIKVKCQEGRAQADNRIKARWILIGKMEGLLNKARLEKKQKSELKKRQNRKRPKFLKEKILQTKRRQSEKKDQRRKIKSNKLDDYI